MSGAQEPQGPQSSGSPATSGSPTPAPTPPPRSRIPASAAIGTVVFAATFMVTVLLYVPYALSGWRRGPPLLGPPSVMFGMGLIWVGAAGILSFLFQFVREGHGTPAPFMPPRRLVVRGPFLYVRNPAYLCAVALVAGQGLYFGHLRVLFYAAILAFAFHLFVIYFEEPTLRRKFGADYEEYCLRVPRWIPRLHRANPP